jgi:hypothetical protein|tara:strand:+ start:662 stop:841 length:180 start_codon:yes stop_codon:yes gene_type:complete
MKQIIEYPNEIFEFEIYYGDIEEPLYLTNNKNYICDDMRDFMEELGIIMEEVIYKVQAI